MAHSNLIGGSTAGRVMNCPGSMLLSQRIPRQESVYAAEGTALHDAAEQCWDGDQFNPRLVKGKTINGFSMDENNRYERLLGALLAVTEWFTENDIYPDDVYLEQQVAFQDDLEGCFGTTDILALGDNEVLVGDFKFGTGVPVSAENNTQLLFYAAAALEDPDTRELFKSADQVRLAIFQPDVEGNCALNEWVVPISVLEDFAADLADALLDAQDPNAEVCEGEWCRFCPAKAVCPKKNQLVQVGLQLDPRLADQLAEAMQIVEEVEQWCKQVRGSAHDALERGDPVPGFKLVQKRATRKWLDAARAEEVVRDLGKIKVGEMMNSTFKSPAQLEKVFKGKKLDMHILDDYIVSTSSGTTVAPEDDPRPAVQVEGMGLPSEPAPKL